MLWLSKQYVGAWRMSLLLPLSMLVGGRTMHARECKGMLVGAGDLLRQIAATKGIKRNTRSCSWQNYQKVGFKVYNKKE